MLKYIEEIIYPNWSSVPIGIVKTKKNLKENFGWKNLKIDENQLEVQASIKLWEFWYNNR